MCMCVGNPCSCVWRMPWEIDGSCLKQIGGNTVATCDLSCIVVVVCYYGVAKARTLGNLQSNISFPTAKEWWGIFFFFSYQRCPVNVMLLFLYLTVWLLSFREYPCLESNLTELYGTKCSQASKLFVLSPLWLFFFVVVQCQGHILHFFYYCCLLSNVFDSYYCPLTNVALAHAAS